jgi:hypothetical protein
LGERPIDELTIHSLHGEFYNEFRKYVERHGGLWIPHYLDSGLLRDVSIQFPRGTVCGELKQTGNYDRRRITFQDGALMFWFVQRRTHLHSISVPYVYL